jgi:hypothetical protein
MTTDPIVAMKAEYDRMQAEISNFSAFNADCDALVERLCDLEAKILQTVATSPDGLIAQIMLLRGCGCNYRPLRDCGCGYGANGWNLLIAGIRSVTASK